MPTLKAASSAFLAQKKIAVAGVSRTPVRNVRAAGGRAVVRHGRTERPLLEEVLVDGRAPIPKAYLKRTAISTRRHLGLKPEAPPEELERIVPAHPVFRIAMPLPAERNQASRPSRVRNLVR